jgi:Secretion system C-terminal sorting domain
VGGQGTACLTVSPNTNGNVTATCLVKRTTGLANYTATSTKVITRSARTLSFVTNPVQDYICKGSGLLFQYANQTGITSVTWNAPNCTVSAESIVNGMRQVTIYPTSSATIGASISINAVANFISGCSATAPSKTFKVYEAGTPPLPSGSFKGNPYPPSSKNYSAMIYKYLDPTSYVNGVTDIDGVNNDNQYEFYVDLLYTTQNLVFTVCNTNPCTGLKTCKNYKITVPKIPSTQGGQVPLRLATQKEVVTEVVTQNITIEPNPSSGSIRVKLPQTLSGYYQIFNINNLVQEAKFNKQTELQIELTNKLKSGIYVIKVFSEDTIFTDKIILNR